MELINLTPHNIDFPADGVTLYASGQVARLDVATETIGHGEYEGAFVPYKTVQYGPVVGLPEPKAGTIYVVSDLVRKACPHRADVASPGDLVRDDQGRVIGCASLIFNAPKEQTMHPLDQ